jgi:signal transduction histidine kinase
MKKIKNSEKHDKHVTLIKSLKEKNLELLKIYSSINKKNKEFIRKTIDLTEIKNELEDKNFELESANKEIMNLLKTRTEFLNRVAHDLRTPLTPITILIPLIKDKVNDEDLKKDLTIVENNTKYLKDLINKLINLIKPQPETSQNLKEELSMKDLIEEVISNEENVFKMHNIKILKKIDGKKFIFMGIRLDIIEVLQNIVTNAIKFMPKKGTLTLMSYKKDNFIYTSIKDTGIGLTKKTISKLFEPFYKADKSRHNEGSGLGLSICKKIIESHGGDIFIQSSGLGKGTNITFTLPIFEEGCQ